MSRQPPPAHVLRFDAGLLDLARRAWVDAEGRTVALSPLESDLLHYLADRVGVTVPRAELLEQVWGYAPGVKSRAVDNTVRRLRQKLDPDDADTSLLQSVYGGGYRFDAVPLRGQVRLASTLPPQAERQGLIGRAEDLRALASALQAHHWVTLSGPGGVGKTSLARALLRDQGGAWVDLTQAHTAAELVATVAVGLGIPPGRDLDESLARIGIALEARTGLMVFDNCEQLDERATAAIAGWADGAPDLHLLTTSRRPLGAAGEHPLPLAPLSSEDALALLVRSARKVAADFHLGPDRERWLRVVELLDGLPLAVELCAPRVGTLSPESLVDRLQRSLGLVRRRPDGRTPDRHLALSRSLQWSWSLLEPDAQQALVALSRIPGAFDLEQAEAVIGTDDALDPIDTLLQASWMHHTPDGTLALYQSVSTFVDEQAAPELREAAEDRRRRWLLERAADAPQSWVFTHITAIERAVWRALERASEEAATLAHSLCRVSAGLDRKRLATVLDAVHARLPADHPLALTLELDRVDLERDRKGLRAELIPRVEHVLDRAHALELESQRVRSLRLLSALVRLLGDLDRAGALLDEAHQAAQASGQLGLQAAVANERGLYAFHIGDHEAARRHHLEGLALYRQLAHPIGEVQSLSNLGKVLRHLGHYDDGERMIREALERLDDGLSFQRAISLTNLGNLELSRGRPDAALEPLEQARELFRRGGALRHLGMVGTSLALAQMMRDNHPEAEAAALESARRLERAGELRTQGRAWSTAATSAIARGDLATAEERLERAQACFETIHLAPGLMGVRRIRCVLLALRGQDGSHLDLEPDDPCRLLAGVVHTDDPAAALRAQGKLDIVREDITAGVLCRALGAR